MKVEFRVENALDRQVSTKATVDGEEHTAHVDGLEVEMVAVDGRHGSLRLNFIGRNLAEAKETFKPGKVVTFTVDGEHVSDERR